MIDIIDNRKINQLHFFKIFKFQKLKNFEKYINKPHNLHNNILN